MFSDTKSQTSSPPTSSDEISKDENNIHSIDEKNTSFEVETDFIMNSEGHNNPEMATEEEPQVSGAKAYYYSQLSVMLFEKSIEENPNFPEDLDRVHSWFVKELTEAQKLVCLRELLSHISPSQHRFLFTSVSFENVKSSDEETVWLDLAMSETQKRLKSPATKLGALEQETKGKLENRLKTLDLTPGLSLFSGLKVALKSKLPASSTLSGDDDFSPSKITKRSFSFDNQANLLMSNHDLTEMISPDLPTSPSPALSTDSNSSKFSGFLNMAPEVEDSTAANAISRKAPPGFLSPNASEYRPSEPSCFADLYFTDVVQWLRQLRLHKYTENLKPHHEKDKMKLLEYSDSELEGAGVSALGARRKFLRLFERIKEEKQL